MNQALKQRLNELDPLLKCGPIRVFETGLLTFSQGATKVCIWTGKTQDRQLLSGSGHQDPLGRGQTKVATLVNGGGWQNEGRCSHDGQQRKFSLWLIRASGQLQSCSSLGPSVLLSALMRRGTGEKCKKGLEVLAG